MDRVSWVKVSTSPGVFSTELTVNIKESNGNDVSILADKHIIHTEGDSEYLKVSAVNDSFAMKEKTILLPTETFETFSRWIVVSSSRIINDIK